jgi:ankyrin repeat protein
LRRFLLAQLHLDSLKDKITRKAIKQAIDKLPKGLNALDHAYEDAMERIKLQEAGFRELAIQVLSWITCTKRPLKTLELQHALTVEIGEPELDEENLPEIEDIISVCAGLVTVDETSGIVRLVHFSTQEYFERTQISWFPDAQRDIATTCVTYLLFDVFKPGFCLTDEEFEARLQSNAFYNYAAQNWGYHVRAASMEAEQLVLGFLESEAKVFASSQAMMASGNSRGYSQEVPRQMTGVHLAAYFGLRKAMIALLEKRYDPNPKDTHHQTPLWWAAKNGHSAVVKLLLATGGVDPDPKSNSGRTPLSWAVANGHSAVVKLLLAENSVDKDYKDAYYGQTPLSRAAENGHSAVVKLLLTIDGINPDSKSNSGRTPLSWAAANGHSAVVKLLLATGGIIPDSKDRFYGRTPLWWAVYNGHSAVVELLLTEDSVDPDSKDIEYGQTPLWWAAKNGHVAVVKLLLTAGGVDPDSKSKNGRTPLWWAAANGHSAVVKLLLATGGIIPDSKDRFYGRTPLSWAAANGHSAVVKLLLATGSVDPDSKDIIHSRTPLSWAAENGHSTVVELLLARDRVNPDSKDRYGHTPLLWAARNGHSAVVKLLLGTGSVDLYSKDRFYGQTPLWWAVDNGHSVVVELLCAEDRFNPEIGTVLPECHVIRTRSVASLLS